MKTFYITTAIDYPSSKPHLGHAYEKICADCIARWHKLLGEDVFFLTGTDEYGSKIQKKAAEAGKSPQQYVDEMSFFFKDLCKKLQIEYNRFIRTTDKDHVQVSMDIFKKIYDNGDIYLGKYEGGYCTDCETFYTEKDLKDGCCPAHGKKVEWLSEESYFFKMGKYKQKVLDYLEKNKESIIPDGKRKEMINRVKEGLNDLSISRANVSWGVPVPINEKHTQYVWIPALLNYVSGIGYPSSTFEKFWPANYNLIGKDIIFHHSAIFWSILMSAGIKLPKTILVHGFINTKSGEKMSKSKGTVVDPVEIADKYSADVLRYFLLREIPFGQDGNFSEKAMIERLNNELANELGNLVNRTLVMLEKYSEAKIPNAKTNTELKKQLDKKKILAQMEKLEFHNALAEIFSFISACNKFINDKAPWKNENEKQRNEVLYSLADSIRIISILLSAFLPQTSKRINSQFGFKPALLKEAEFNLAKAGTKIKKGEILFKKIVEV